MACIQSGVKQYHHVSILSLSEGSFPLQSNLPFFMDTHAPVWTVCLHMSFLVFIGGTFSCFLQQLRCWVHFIARNVTNYLALQKCSQCVHSGSFWTQCGFSSLSRMPVHSRHCCEAGTAGQHTPSPFLGTWVFPGKCSWRSLQTLSSFRCLPLASTMDAAPSSRSLKSSHSYFSSSVSTCGANLSASLTIGA